LEDLTVLSDPVLLLISLPTAIIKVMGFTYFRVSSIGGSEFGFHIALRAVKD